MVYLLMSALNAMFQGCQDHSAVFPASSHVWPMLGKQIWSDMPSQSEVKLKGSVFEFIAKWKEVEVRYEGRLEGFF